MSTGLTQNRAGVRYQVFVDGVEVDDLKVEKVTQASGGRVANTAVLVRDLDVGEHLEFFECRDIVGQVIHILHQDELKWVHFGRIQSANIAITERGEQLVVTSRLEPWQMSLMIHGYEVWNLDQNNEFTIDEPLIFNPLVDKKITPNMGQDSLTGNPHKAFIDSEMVRTQTAIDENNLGDDPAMWTLEQAILYLCWKCNPDEELFDNPTSTDIGTGLGYGNSGEQISLDDALIFNHRINTPAYLPDMLDDLLEPYGCSWYVDFGQEGASSVAPNPGAIRPKIQFYRRGGTKNFVGQSEVVTLPLQAIGDSLSIDESAVTDLAVEYSIDTITNDLRVMGDFVEVEATFELYKAWAEELDDEDEDALSDESAAWEADPRIRDVWRKWALNEANDYKDLRAEITEAYNLQTLFEAHVGDDEEWVTTRRRRFWPTLATKEDGTPVGDVEGCRIEWWNKDDQSWHPISELHGCSCQVLNKECGVYFSGNLPPKEIQRQGDNAKVRITATIRSDKQYRYDTGLADDSVQPDAVGTIIDARQRFHFRFVDNTSQYYTDVSGETLSSNEADDTEAIGTFAEELLTTFNTATTSGTISLEGLDRLALGTINEIRIGHSVSGVSGRDVFFNGKRFESASWPQITGIQYDYTNQKTLLTLNTIKQQYPV